MLKPIKKQESSALVNVLSPFELPYGKRSLTLINKSINSYLGVLLFDIVDVDVPVDVVVANGIIIVDVEVKKLVDVLVVVKIFVEGVLVIGKTVDGPFKKMN